MSKHRRHHHSNSGPITRQQGQTYQYSHFNLAAKPQVPPFQYDGKHGSTKPVKGLPAPKRGTNKVAALNDPKEVIEDAGKKYVVDTNVLISCPNIIADPNDELWQEVIGADPKLDNATIIIPQVVFDELDHMKSEVSHRGMVARMLLRRLANIIPNTKRSLEDIATMHNPVPMGWKNQSVCILPLPKDFYHILPWVPDRDDNDGWIAVTALYATLFFEGVDINALISKRKDAPTTEQPKVDDTKKSETSNTEQPKEGDTKESEVDSTEQPKVDNIEQPEVDDTEKSEECKTKELQDDTTPKQFDIMQWRTKKKADSTVFLMTNDNGLLVRANSYGVRTKHFRFKKPRVITGFRDMIVPREFYELALDSTKDGLEAEYFEQFFPEEPPLTANEYIIMHLEHEGGFPSEYLIDSAEFKNIFRYHKKNNRLYPMRCVNKEGQKPINAGIAAYYDAMNDRNI